MTKSERGRLSKIRPGKRRGLRRSLAKRLGPSPAKYRRTRR